MSDRKDHFAERLNRKATARVPTHLHHSPRPYGIAGLFPGVPKDPTSEREQVPGVESFVIEYYYLILVQL